LLELGGHPAGTVTLERRGGEYRYTSRHLFAVDDAALERVREGRYRIDAQGRTEDGALPAGLWLWRRPEPGCVQGLEELDETRGPQCARSGPDGSIVGELRGTPFVAHYDRSGVLRSLEVGGAVLRSSTGREATAGRAVQEVGSAALLRGLSGGLPLPPGRGPLAWSRTDFTSPVEGMTPWSESAARALAREVDASFSDKRYGAADLDSARDRDVRGGCLAHARRFVARARRLGVAAAVVHGLVAHEGGLRPHAWVRVSLGGTRLLELDPALGVPVDGSTHLALGAVREGARAPELGSRWLSVWSGEARVVRRPSPTAGPR
jgi:hypothetical protein